MNGTGVWEPVVSKLERGDELVVRGEEGAGTVEDGDSCVLQALQRSEAALGTVERRPNVDPPDDDVAVPKRAVVPFGWNEGRVVGERRSNVEQSAIRRVEPVCNDCEALCPSDHRVSTRPSGAPRPAPGGPPA